jgi:hypothetical protein
VALPEGSAKDDREGHPLQNVKGQGLCWSWRNWLEDQLGLAEKSVEEFWAVLQSLGPVFARVTSWSMLVAAQLPRPRLTWVPGSHALRVGALSGPRSAPAGVAGEA